MGLFVFAYVERTIRRRKSSSSELATGIAFYRQTPRLLFFAAVLSLFVQVLNVILLWCLVEALSIAVPFNYCFIIMPVVAIVTLAPISVNGMGVREGATFCCFRRLGWSRNRL